MKKKRGKVHFVTQIPVSPRQHLGRKGLLSSPINHEVGGRGARSFEEAGEHQDGGLPVKQRPPLKHVAVEVRQNLTDM